MLSKVEDGVGGIHKGVREVSIHGDFFKSGWTVLFDRGGSMQMGHNHHSHCISSVVRGICYEQSRWSTMYPSFTWYPCLHSSVMIL